MQDFISTETSSQTAMACEQSALFGATPGPDEFDNREIWNEDEALAGIEEAIHILAGVVAPDGTQLADERESLLSEAITRAVLTPMVGIAVRSTPIISCSARDIAFSFEATDLVPREVFGAVAEEAAAPGVSFDVVPPAGSFGGVRLSICAVIRASQSWSCCLRKS